MGIDYFAVNEVLNFVFQGEVRFCVMSLPSRMVLIGEGRVDSQRKRARQRLWRYGGQMLSFEELIVGFCLGARQASEFSILPTFFVKVGVRLVCSGSKVGCLGSGDWDVDNRGRQLRSCLVLGVVLLWLSWQDSRYFPLLLASTSSGCHLFHSI